LYKQFSYALLVPCYNAEKYINSFLDHIANLNEKFDEVLFYDDGSTDDSYKLLISRGVNVIKGQANMGPGYARNRLAENAKSDYIHFHDIDDEFNLAFISLIDAQAKAISPDIILGYADWIDSLTRNVIIKWRYDEHEIQENPLTYFISNPLGIINTVYKKKAFCKTGGFNETIKCWEDADLHVRLAASGFSFSVVPEILAYSLRHNSGISNDQQWCWACRLKFVQIYLEQYGALVNKYVFKAELDKIKTAFVNMGRYEHLNKIIGLNKRFQLGIKTRKISIINYLNKIFPTIMLKKAIRLFSNKTR